MVTLADTTPVLPRQQVQRRRLVESLQPEPAALFVLVIRVFSDLGWDGTQLARPGFAGLLDASSVSTDARLVTPDLSHLSPFGVIREGLLRQVRRTGARLVVTPEVNGKPDDVGTAEASTYIGDEPNGGPS
jgi:hypothetical protein